MRIGIDARLYRSSIAGIGRYSQNLIKNLLEIDSDNQYILFMTPEDEEEFRNLKLEIRNSNFVTKIVDIPHYSLVEQTKFPKIIEQEKIDLMHFLNFNYPVSYKGKFIVTIHDLTLFFYPGRSKKSLIYKIGYKYIMGRACKNAAEIIAVSEATKKDIMRVFKTPSKKIKVVYEAADDKIFTKPSPEVIDSLKKRYAIGDKPVVLYVGQWRPHKNLLGLINAFNIVKEKTPVKLAIIGKVDPAYLEVISAIDKAVTLGDIIMPGFVTEEELSCWYKIASVFVFPSFYEGFGLPGLEAMMAGTPVISSDRTSLPEIYKDGAIYFNPFKIKDMADKIKEVIIDERLRLELVEKANMIVTQYSWRKTAQETLEIYKNSLKS